MVLQAVFSPKGLCILCLVFCFTLSRCQDTCNKRADIVFIVDDSGSINRGEYETLLNFSANLMGALDIGKGQVRVGLMTFNADAYPYMYLNQFDDKQRLIDYVLQRPYSAEAETVFIPAINFAKDVMFSASRGDRPGVPNIAILITDGHSSQKNYSANRAVAAAAKAAQIMVFVVGIGLDTDQEEMEIMASNLSYIFKANDFNELAKIDQALQRAMCEAIPICEKQQDIVFLLDTSDDLDSDLDFTRVLDFVASITRFFNIGQSGVRIGLMTLGKDPEVRFHLSDFEEQQSLLDAIGNVSFSGTTGGNLDSALRLLRNTMFSAEHGDRGEVSDVAVLIKTGQPGGSGLLSVPQATLLRDEGVTLYCVGVGAKTQPLLESLAYDSSTVFIVNSSAELSQIAARVERRVCKDEDSTCEHHTVTIVGLGLAIAFLLFLILAFLLFSKLRQGSAQSTLLCLAIALLLSWVIYLAGFTFDRNYTVCLTVAALLHYILLASFLWMLMEGLLQFLLFASKDGNVPKYIRKVFFVAWGLPLIPVIVVLATDKDQYVTARECCWMSLDSFPFLYTLLLPLGVIVVVTVVMDAVALLGNCCVSKRKGGPGVLASFFALILLVLAWMSFYLSYTQPDRDELLFAFPVCAALQAILLFFIFCVRDSKALPCVREAAVQPKDPPPADTASPVEDLDKED